MAPAIAIQQASRVGIKGQQQRSWAQVAQGSNKINPTQTRNWFRSQKAVVKPSETSYAPNHLLGTPQEIRDAIIELLCPTEEVIGGRPKHGYKNYQLVCRQTFHETSRRWNYQPTVLVPSNRSEEFITRTLDITVLHSNAYHNVKKLFFEIRHNAPGNVFRQLAQVLRLSTHLEELHLFGVGLDGYGASTSSVGHGCGKHDTSITGVGISKLQIEGQNYVQRLTMVNSIIWLEHLRVLVLDNLNMPLLQAHVLKNKPRLEKLYIVADPRSMLHAEYKNHEGLGLGSLIFPILQDFPPVKDLHISSNAIFTASSITSRVASTLKSLAWVIPDVEYQQHVDKLGFYTEAAFLLSRLHLEARRLRELRICVHGPMSEHHWHYADFMGALRNSVSRMQHLQVVEVHIHSKSQWFAYEFIDSLPPSVIRLYLSDLFIDRDVKRLCNSIGVKTATPPNYAIDFGTVAIGEDLQRQDFINFSRSKLAFVGFEYEQGLQAKVADAQDRDIMALFKLNGRILDKERNRHLARLAGDFIPPNKGVKGKGVEDTQLGTDNLEPAKAEKEMEEIRNGWAECVLGDEDDYFGSEHDAEVVFHDEGVVRGGHFSYPAVVEVDDQFKFGNHWLSK